MTGRHRLTSGARASDGLSALANMTDHDIVRRVQGGDTEAFEELVNRTSEVCLRVATCILRRPEDARDEVQSAYWLAYSRLDSFTCQAKFSTWLTRIVINRCFMRLRNSRRTPILANNVMTESGEWFTYEGVTHDTPEAGLGQKEVYLALRRELGSIPPLLRIPIELHYIRELSLKEVANELGVSISAVKSRLHRGQLYLRDRMLKHSGNRGPAILTT